jgi:hypothetical protein
MARRGGYQIPAPLQNKMRMAVAAHSQFSMRFAKVALGRVLTE